MYYQKIPLAAFLAVLAVILPFFFHLVGMGSKFLPMYIPLVFGSLVLPLKLSLSIIIIAPLVSFLFTGMPPLFPPILPIMMGELLIICSFCYYLFQKSKKSLWFSLILSLLIGRLFLFIVVYLGSPIFGLPQEVFSILMVIQGIPGLILILIVLPATFKFLGAKYPNLFSPQSKDAK